MKSFIFGTVDRTKSLKEVETGLMMKKCQLLVANWILKQNGGCIWGYTDKNA